MALLLKEKTQGCSPEEIFLCPIYGLLLAHINSVEAN